MDADEAKYQTALNVQRLRKSMQTLKDCYGQLIVFAENMGADEMQLARMRKQHRDMK